MMYTPTGVSSHSCEILRCAQDDKPRVFSSSRMFVTPCRFPDEYIGVNMACPRPAEAYPTLASSPASLYDAPILDIKDAMSSFNDGGIMSGHEHADLRLLCCFTQQRSNLACGHRVQVACRFISDDEAR